MNSWYKWRRVVTGHEDTPIQGQIHMFAKTLKVMMIINVNTNTCTGMSLHDLMMGLLAGYPKLSLWHVDDFQLKTIKAQQTQEELFIPFSTALENLDRGLVPERERERERETLATLTFFIERLICMIQQTFVYQTSALAIFLWIAFLPFQVPDPYTPLP